MFQTLAMPVDRTVKIDGRKFSALRRKLSKSQGELAKEMGVTVGRVSAIEQSDEPTGLYLNTFGKLARFANVDPETLREQLKPEAAAPTVSVDLPASAHAEIEQAAKAKGVSVADFIVKRLTKRGVATMTEAAPSPPPATRAREPGTSRK